MEQSTNNKSTVTNNLVANSLDQFKKQLQEKIAGYIKLFSQEVEKSLRGKYNDKFCQRHFQNLSRKYARTFRKTYQSIAWFNAKHYRFSDGKSGYFFSLQKPFESFRQCHDSFLFKLKQFLERKKIDLDLVNHVATKEEFIQSVTEIKNNALLEIKRNFDETACLVDYLPKRMITKTFGIQENIKKRINLVFDLIVNKSLHKNTYVLPERKVVDGKRYSVLKVRKHFGLLVRQLEKKFWKFEDKKVRYLNKPHKKQKDIPEIPKQNLHLRNVYKFYTNGVCTFKALNDINLDINMGEFVVIFGPSGSGKTTLLNIISGMDRASSGYVYCNGINLIKLSNNSLTKFRRKNIGYVFQQYGLLPSLTVKENVEIGSYLQKSFSMKVDTDVLLNNVGMLDKKDSLPIELSGGQQQRVSIARAIAKNPLIIFADEPTAALDDVTTKIIMNLFQSLNEKYKTTFVVVTHNETFGKLADKIISVRNGVIESVVLNKEKQKFDE